MARRKREEADPHELLVRIDERVEGILEHLAKLNGQVDKNTKFRHYFIGIFSFVSFSAALVGVAIALVQIGG